MRLLNDELVPVGKVLKSYGIKGWLKIKYFSADYENIKSFKSLFVTIGSDFHPYRNEGIKKLNGFLALKFAGIDTLDAAEIFRGCFIYAERASFIPLKEGEFYLTDIIGLDVIDSKGVYIGKVESFIDVNLKQTLLVVKKEKKEVLIPLIKEFIKEVNLTEKVLVVELPEGLIE